MYSGASAIPTTSSVSARPLTIAPIVEPGTSPWAWAKDSLTVTSSPWPSRGSRPPRSTMSFRPGVPSSGIEIRRPVAGSAISGTSSVTSATTRVSTRWTPGIARNWRATRSGARRRLANTWAKRSWA